MVTILKFPVYVEIETGNVDRSLVTRSAQEILLPQLLTYLSSGKYKSSVLASFSKAIGSPANVTLLTELELLRDRMAPKSHHKEEDNG